MNMKKSILLLLMMMVCMCAASQGIGGRVVGSHGEAVRDANVVLQRSDSSFVDVAVTDEAGCFSFVHSLDRFRLVVHHLAYRSKELVADTPNVGDIVLEPSDVELGDLVVSSGRPLVRVEDGKLAYDLEQLTKDKVANNTYEALTKLPGVSEKEQKLSLAGAGSLTLLINGRPTTMTQEQVTALLKSTPVERVQKAEVMYSAPPQYHTRGAVINIVLKKDTQYSLQGEVGATYRNKFYSEGEAHAFLRAATPKQAFDIMYSANRLSDVQDVDMRSLHTLNGVVHDIRQMQKIRGRAWLHNARASYEYSFNDKNSFSLAYNRQFKSDLDARTHSKGNFQIADNVKDVEKDDMHNFSLQASLGFGLSAGADYTLYDSRSRQTMSVDYLNGNVASMSQSAGQKVRALNAYADQTHSLGKGWTLGYGASYRNSESDDYQRYDAESTITGTAVDASLSEHTAEGYLSVGRQSPMGLSFTLSATAEFYKLNNRERWTLYPQASLTYMSNPDHIFQGTLQVQKLYPSYWQMQDAVGYIDGYAELHNTSGLEPSKLYSLNANYIFRQKYVFGAFMTYNHKMFAQAMYQSSERLALIYQTHNWDYISQTGLLAVIPYKPVEWFDTRATIVGVYVSQRCDDFFDIGFEDKSFVGMLTVDNSFRVNKDLVFELNGFVQTPAMQGTFSIETMWSVSAGAKWNFAKGKGTVSCYYNDIFNSTIGDMKMNYKGQNLINRNDFHTRNFSLSVAYRFGGYKKKEDKKVDTSRFGH